MRQTIAYTVGKRFAFAASHRLAGLPDAHKCGRMHGHTYSVEVVAEGDLDAVGFVVDFGDLDWVGELLAEKLDHRHLNDVLPFNPTSENIAAWLLTSVVDWVRTSGADDRLTRIRVRVEESPRTFATAEQLLR